MSRVGKNPVAIPAGRHRRPQGPGISRSRASAASSRSSSMTTSRSPRTATSLIFKPRTDSRRARMQWGTARNLASNMVRGVSDGFTINLEINGVGYRAQADAKNLKLQLGFSHDVEVPIPGRHPDQGGEADRDRDHRRGSSEGRTARGGDPQPASARALQGQGHQVLDREDPPQGRQEEVEARHHVRHATPFSPAASGARATRCARPPAAARASASSARASTSMPRSSTTVRARRSRPPRRSTRTSRASSRPAPTSRRRPRSAS